MHFYDEAASVFAVRGRKKKKGRQRTIKVINQYGPEDVVRIVRGTRSSPLSQRFRQEGLHDELALSRDATSDPAAIGRSFCPAPGTKHRGLKNEHQ